MKNNQEKKLNLSAYRTLGMPLLVLMGLLALVGIVSTVVLHYL